MSDQNAFSEHIEKLLFIKRLQARENLFNKFLTGQGILADGGGMAHGGGLGSGGGIDDGGFKNRRPAIQTEMVTSFKGDDVIRAEDNIEELVNNEKYRDDSKVNTVAYVDDTGADKDITLSGITKSIWDKKMIDNIYNYAVRNVAEYDAKQHDPDNFKGTTPKSIIFEKDGKILKFKSIAGFSKYTGFSKYQILKGFKPKKHGDSFVHEKMGGTLTFVDKKTYDKEHNK
jgi:hypothetical protein